MRLPYLSLRTITRNTDRDHSLVCWLLVSTWQRIGSCWGCHVVDLGFLKFCETGLFWIMNFETEDEVFWSVFIYDACTYSLQSDHYLKLLAFPLNFYEWNVAKFRVLLSPRLCWNGFLLVLYIVLTRLFSLPLTRILVGHRTSNTMATSRYKSI